MFQTLLMLKVAKFIIISKSLAKSYFSDQGNGVRGKAGLKCVNDKQKEKPQITQIARIGTNGFLYFVDICVIRVICGCKLFSNGCLKKRKLLLLFFLFAGAK
jgi:hypothetical protein